MLLARTAADKAGTFFKASTLLAGAYLGERGFHDVERHALLLDPRSLESEALFGAD